MPHWVWICALGGLVTASTDEDGCNLQKVDVDAASKLSARAEAQDTGVPTLVSTPNASTEALLETKQQFATLEVLLRHKKPEPKLVPAPAQGDVGFVKAVYTFAAPPLTRGYQMLDGREADGVFPGLRVWTRAPDGKFDLISRSSLWFRHPKITSLEISVGEAIGSITVGNFTTPLYDGVSKKVDPRVSDTSTLPYGGRGSACTKTYAKCHEDYYWQNYSKIGEPQLDLPYRFSMDAYEYWGESVVRSLELAKHQAKFQGYRLVGRAIIPPRQAFSFDVHNDNVHLWQHEESLECILAFEGSDLSVNDWIANFHSTARDFCGYHNVHRGFGDKLRFQTTSLAWSLNIKTKLPACASVTVTGHSAGGGLAQLFAGCVNRAMLPDTTYGRADYAAAIWVPALSRLLDEVD